MTGYSLDTRSNVTQGPIVFGATTSGGGPVTFGGGAPNTAAALATGITAHPLLLMGLVAGAVAIVWLMYRH